MANELLLTAKDIEKIWQQLSMKPLSNSLFRFASEVAMKQAEITHVKTLKAVGEWLRERTIEVGDESPIVMSDINMLLAGDMPRERKKI